MERQIFKNKDIDDADDNERVRELWNYKSFIFLFERESGDIFLSLSGLKKTPLTKGRSIATAEDILRGHQLPQVWIESSRLQYIPRG